MSIGKKNIKISGNNRQSDYEYENECNEIEALSTEVTWVFVNKKLRIIDENIEVQEENQEEVNRTTLEDEVVQVIANKEAIVVTHTSVKNSNVTGV